MTIRNRLVLWYAGLLLAGLLLVAGWAYYEMVVAHPGLTRALAVEGHTPLEEFGEIVLFGGLPAVVLALVGGWFLMRRALQPLSALIDAVNQVHASTLGTRLPRTCNGDELDQLTEVVNSMMTRLDSSFTQAREFTLHASHELKTPLTILRAEIETALQDPATPEPQREIFADQLDEIARLTKIVDSLTLLAKADAGQLTLVRASVRFDELVRDSFADAQLLARPARITVQLTACDEAIVHGDRHRLKQLLLSLTDNAIKYTQPDGRIEFNLRGRGEIAELTLANTGPGIAPEKLPRVFERFYRGDPSRSSSIEGCGLGLSISQWIVKAHGGEVRIESEPGVRTCVRVSLPLAGRRDSSRDG